MPIKMILLSLVVLIAIAGAVAAVPLGGGSGDAGSELPLDYPWSASEQAQRNLAVERKDANFLPECTEH